MKTFTDYAEAAIKRYGLTGYNNLARELELNKATISFFRAGKALPSEVTMIKLADLAGLPKEEALIDLNLWRSKKNPELQKVWQRLAKMIGGVFGGLLIPFDCHAAFNVSPTTDLKGVLFLSIMIATLHVLYIMRQN